MKETHPRALGLSASNRARGLPGLLQLEVIAPGGVGVVTATARPAPAEGGGGLGEWVTSRSRRQAVWAAEPMNQLSGERARRAGGGCWNAPGAARPGRREALRSAPPRPAGPGAAGAFLAKLGWRSLLLALGLPLGPLTLCQFLHQCALCREARELGLVRLERTCFPPIVTMPFTH